MKVRNEGHSRASPKKGISRFSTIMKKVIMSQLVKLKIIQFSQNHAHNKGLFTPSLTKKTSRNHAISFSFPRNHATKNGHSRNRAYLWGVWSISKKNFQSLLQPWLREKDKMSQIEGHSRAFLKDIISKKNSGKMKEMIRKLYEGN